MLEITFIYCCFPHKKTAQEMAKILLKEKLCHCCNIHNTDSIYLEEDKIYENKEVAMFIKAKKENEVLITELIEKYHPYNTPVIISYPAKINQKAHNWINS
jgi:periplasmic divalent cation tolerance protein